MQKINVSDFIEYNKAHTFSEDQKKCIEDIFTFFGDGRKAIGFYGFAGTGKTTTIIKILMYIIAKQYMTNIACTALTNKAVNILKSKFMTEFDNITPGASFFDTIARLAFDGMCLDFITTHKLLGVARDFNVDGSVVFRLSNKCSIDKYQLVIIDECSMISKDILKEITLQIDKHNAKVIFIGDPGQLPPVNESISKLFSDNTITSMTMKNIVRSNYSSIINLSNEVRAWIFNEIKIPILGKFKGPNVLMYKYNPSNGTKTKTEWFTRFIEQTAHHNTLNTIILTWTNKQTDEYNNVARSVINKTSELNKYEIGDILILSTFYNLKEDHDEKENKFYTSEQVRIKGVDVVNKILSKFVENVMQTVPLSPGIKTKYISTMRSLNKKINREYKCHKLIVSKLNDQEQCQNIYILDEHTQKDHQMTLNKIIADIHKMIEYYELHYKNDMGLIELHIIKNFWSEFNKNYIDQFANVNYGYSTTVHKSQSSTYQNVFIDMDDIIKNKNENDMKRCLYTAVTRASERLYILI